MLIIKEYVYKYCKFDILICLQDEWQISNVDNANGCAETGVSIILYFHGGSHIRF